MGLFDVFSFKKEANKVLNKEVFVEVLKKAREGIIERVKENMPGVEKKEQLDLSLLSFIDKKVLEAGIKNKLVLWVIDKLKDLLPRVSQIVYDFLKEKVDNL